MAAYEPAVCDMIDRTSTENAAWILVEADNKYFARVKILAPRLSRSSRVHHQEMKDICPLKC
jgi:polyphosphate kinase 2 (PPK2 family)